MPLYIYEVVTDDGSEGERFELLQKMSDEPLTVHPVSGLPVERVITAPNLPSQYTDRAEQNRISDQNLDRLGFTKYVKGDDGSYEKTAGQGPSKIRT